MTNSTDLVSSEAAKQEEELKNFSFNRPLTSKAAIAFNKPGLLFPVEVGERHPAPNQFIPFRSLCFLAQAIGRQIDFEDLKALFVDEGVQTCSVFEDKTRALSWAILNKGANTRIANNINDGLSFGDAVKRATKFVGPFWIEGYENIVFYSGTPHDEDKDTSALIQKYLRSEKRWGMSLGQAREITKKHRCRRDRINNCLGKNWPGSKK